MHTLPLTGYPLSGPDPDPHPATTAGSGSRRAGGGI